MPARPTCRSTCASRRSTPRHTARLWGPRRRRGENWARCSAGGRSLFRGPYAIAAALAGRDAGRLRPGAEVLVTTTTGTPYVSGCVTRAIEGVARGPLPVRTHRGRGPHPRIRVATSGCRGLARVLRRAGLAACGRLRHGLGSDGTGTWGDVVVYSATKTFPGPARRVPGGHEHPADHVARPRLF